MSLAKLYGSMALSFIVVTGVSLFMLYLIMLMLGAPIITIAIVLVGATYLLQWIISPYIIDAMYRARPLDLSEEPWLHQAVSDIASRSGVKKPKLMIAHIAIPNAFAYGNPIAGYRVAVTDGLLNLKGITQQEVTAIVGHEIGHLKHRDVAFMMIVGLLPALVLWIGEFLIRWGWLAGFSNRRRDSLTPLAIIAIGAVAILIGFLLNLGILYLSRLREYYADAHSAKVVPGGAKYLQRALARILLATGYLKRRGINTEKYGQLKMLFISATEHSIDPAGFYGNIDAVVEEIKRMKPSLLAEIFSTHPHPAKRFAFLDRLELYSA
ncbi:MAG: M48 family metalloprotease [Desulfurococcaceae archaeon]